MCRIELLKTHTHAGVEYSAGKVIEVDESTAQWLIEQCVGKHSIDQFAVKLNAKRSETK